MTYNLEKINELSGGDLAFVKEVVGAFIEEIPGDLVNFKQAIEAGNYQLIYQVSHKIKPNLDLLGMNSSYELNLKVLEWAKEKENLADIAVAYEKINTWVSDNIIAMKQEFNL